MPSLMNGLSTMGQGVAAFAGTAGLEAQRSQLAQQQAILADQLATTRETALQGQQQQATAGLQASAQTFQAGQSTQSQAAEMARTQVSEAGATARTLAQINAPPDVVKVLRAFHMMPDDAAGGGGGSAAAAPAPSNGAAAPSDTSAFAIDGSNAAPGEASAMPTGASAGPTAPSGAASAAPTNPNADMAKILVMKSLGLGTPGSDVANRAALAADVNNDPQFKYATEGQKATEIMTREAVATGKMADPATRQLMGTAIGNYQLPGLSNYALAKPGGPEIMAAALKANPDYQAARYPEVNAAMTAFGSGTQGNIVRSINVGVQHLSVVDQAGAALANNDTRTLNSLKNIFESQFGRPEPTTFDALKQIVGTEVEKAVAGGIGASADRDRLMEALDRANSPAQLQAVTNGFRSLMVGQLAGLKTQYDDATGMKTGPFAFDNKLVPETKTALGNFHGTPTAAPPVPQPAAPTPGIPAWVKPGDQYSPSRGQARTADGSIYEAPE